MARVDEFEELVIPKKYIDLLIAIREVDQAKLVLLHEVAINEEWEDYPKVLERFYSVRSLVFGLNFTV